MPNIPQEPMTVAEAAVLLHCDVRTIHRMIARGELTAVKAHSGLRAPYLIARADVEASAAA